MKLFFIVLSLFSFSLSAFAEPVDVYILSGQSNMQGSGALAELSEAQRTPIPLAQFWNGESFEALTPGKTKLSSDLKRFGPELQFARRVAADNPDTPFYIIKYHASGQPLDRGMSSQGWLGEASGLKRSNFYPGELDSDPHMGTCYRGLLNTARAGLAELDTQGIAYRVRGFVWMQGEADGKHEIPAQLYAQNIRHLHERLLADLKLPPSPLVYGQVLPHSPPNERFTHRDEVRQSQANADHASGHVNAYAWAHMVSTDGVELRQDTVHYSSAGLMVLGDRFYETLLKANGE